MSRLIPLLCVAVAVGSLSAHAQKPRVVVVPFATGEGTSETAMTKFQSLLVDELKSRGDVLDLVPAPATKAVVPTVAPTAARKTPSPEALGAMDAGRKAFDDLRFEDAVASLRKGIDAMLADPATADFDSVIDAHVKLAAAAFRMGEEKDAKTALLDLARIDPNYTLPGGFPPVFVREFEKAKKRLEKQPKGTISVEGPAGSTAFIDGRDLGMLPVLEENIAGGPHYVKVEGTKGERFGQTVSVTGGVVKVKASFAGGADSRAVVVSKAAVADPSITAIVDEATQGRLSAYLKAANAEYALIGYVYKTSDAQLTAGTALFSGKKSAFTTLTPVAFDADVLTANTEAFKLGDEVTKRLTAFGASASLPINLASRTAKAGTSTVVARNDAPVNPDELETSGPKSKKPVLTPKVVEKPVEVESEIVQKPEETQRPAEAKAGVPAWVWVVSGVAVAAGLGVGGYFLATDLTKPVTGTVTATW